VLISIGDLQQKIKEAKANDSYFSEEQVFFLGQIFLITTFRFWNGSAKSVWLSNIYMTIELFIEILKSTTFF